MSQYRFLGDKADIVGIASLTRFGQSVELSDAVAFQAISENLQVLPDQIFESIGFTEEELKKYPGAVQQHSAPSDFQEKKVKALELLHEYRLSILAKQA